MNRGGHRDAGRKVVFLGVPMAIGVRDVLRTDVFRTLQRGGVELHVFTPAAENPAFSREFAGTRVTLHPQRRPRSRMFEAVERAVARLHVLVQSARCETVRIMVSRQLDSSGVARIAQWLVKAVGPPGQDMALRLARWLMLRTLPATYEDLFRDLRPDLVVGTRVLTMSGPRSPEAERYQDRYLLMEGKRLGVATQVLVASWDNLTSQGFFPFEPDQVVVWNRMMKAEAMQVHGIPEDRVVVAGAPQHDVYSGAPYSDRTEFLGAFGLDPRRPVVVYTTQTEGLVPDEPSIAASVRRSLEGHPGRPQLLIRVHQLDRMERYEELACLPDVALDQAGSESLPEFPDRLFDLRALRSLADTLAHADVVVNTASSISIDAAAVGTPVVTVGFDPGGARPYWDSVLRFYDYTHQRHVVRSGGIRLARNQAELTREIHAYLAYRDRDVEGRRRLVEEQCFQIDGRSGERVGRAVLDAVEDARSRAMVPSAHPGTALAAS